MEPVVQERAYELFAVVMLQPRRPVRERAVRRRVGLVERVAREAHDVVEDPVRHLFGDPVRDASLYRHLVRLAYSAVHEVLSLLQKFREILFAHRPTNEVRLAERESRELLEELHDLLLVDRHPVRDAEDLLLHGNVVDYLLLAALSAAKRVYVGHGAGAVERDARDEVLYAVRAEVFHEPLHAPGFELEDSVRVAVRYHLVNLRIVLSHLVEVYRDAAILLDVVRALLYIGERHESQKVHLQHAEALYLLRGELGRNVVAVLRERDVVRELLLAYHDARRVHAGLARHALEHHRGVYDLFVGRVGLVHLAKIGAAGRAHRLVALSKLLGPLVVLLFRDLLLHGVEPEAEVGSYRVAAVQRLSEPVHVRKRHVHDPRDVSDGVFRRHRGERHNLADVLASVLLADVLYSLLAPLGAKVNVEIRHGHAVRVQESLEEEIVTKRLHVRDPYRVRNYRAHSGPSPRAHRDVVALGPVYEVPHDEKIVRISRHRADYVELIRRSLFLPLAGVPVAANEPLVSELS